MFESPAKQNPCFYYCRQRAPNDRRLIIYSVLRVLVRGHELSRSANAVLAGNRKFFSLSFNALDPGGPFEFIEKLYGSWNQSYSGSRRRWRFGDPSLHRFWLIHPCDGQTDRQTIAMAKTRWKPERAAPILFYFISALCTHRYFRRHTHMGAACALSVTHIGESWTLVQKKLNPV